MTDYFRAIKRPFTDLVKLLIGLMVEIVPIVNLAALGYRLECSKGGSLPEWKDLKVLFVKGLKAVVIILVYILPSLVIFIPLSAVLVFLFGFNALAALVAGDLSFLSGSFLIFLILEIFLAFILFIPPGYVSPLALIAFERTRRFEEAFNFRLIIKKAFTRKYFSAWLIVHLYAMPLMLIALALSFFIPFIYTLPAFMVGVTEYTIYGEVYDGIEVV